MLGYYWDFCFVFLDIFFIYIQIFIPFPHFPSKNATFQYPFPCSLTHPLLHLCPGIPLHWGIKPFQDQGPFLPLMSNKASHSVQNFLSALCLKPFKFGIFFDISSSSIIIFIPKILLFISCILCLLCLQLSLCLG